MQLLVNNVLLHEIERDDDGAGWIKPNDTAKKQKGIVGNLDRRREEAREIHERYGHISYDTLQTLANFPRLERPYPRCEACKKGKATKPPAKFQGKDTIRTTRRLERLHADLVRTISPITHGKQYKYLLVTIDAYTRYMTV